MSGFNHQIIFKTLTKQNQDLKNANELLERDNLRLRAQVQMLKAQLSVKSTEVDMQGEIHGMVMSFLPMSKVLECSLVCHKWCKVSVRNPVWRSLLRTRFGRSPFMMRQLEETKSDNWKQVYLRNHDKICIIEPQQLYFDPIFDKVRTHGLNRCFSTCLTPLQLTNISHNLVIVFKIKTTAPGTYTVKPAHGQIQPGQCVRVHIRQRRVLPWNATDHRRDKFLVQMIVATPDSVPTDNLLRNADRCCVKCKLKCSFHPPPQIPGQPIRRHYSPSQLPYPQPPHGTSPYENLHYPPVYRADSRSSSHAQARPSTSSSWNGLDDDSRVEAPSRGSDEIRGLGSMSGGRESSADPPLEAGTLAAIMPKEKRSEGLYDAWICLMKDLPEATRAQLRRAVPAPTALGRLSEPTPGETLGACAAM